MRAVRERPAIGWDPRWTATGRARRLARLMADAPLVAPGTRPCGHCWGQRRILRAAGNGEGLIPVVCGQCGGAGRVPTGGGS